jgi:predicted MFS family arabinose efflux permease
MIRTYARDLSAAGPSARAYLWGSALMGIGGAAVFTFFARWLDALGWTKAEVGQILSAQSWGKALVALPAAILVARRPVRGLFVLAAAIQGVVWLAMPWLARAGDAALPLLSAASLLAGIAGTVHYIAIAPFLFRTAPAQARAGLFGLAEATQTLSAVVAATGVGWLVDRIMTAGTSASPALGLDAAEAQAGLPVLTLAGLASFAAAWMFARIRGDAGSGLSKDTRVLQVARAHAGVIARFAAPQLLISWGAGFCIPFLPLYFKDRFGFEPAAWGGLFASGQVLMSAGLLLTPVAVRRLGFVRSQVAIELTSIPFFLVLAWTDQLELAIVAFLLRGALMNSTHPILKHLMMRATPPGVREVQAGVNATLWGVGWALGPFLGGLVLERSGGDYSILMKTTAALYVAAATMTWVLLRPVEQRGEVEPEDAGQKGAVPEDAVSQAG